VRRKSKMQNAVNKLRDEIKKKPAVMFTVPNTPEGRAFIKQMKSYLNTKSYAIRQRGRTPTEDSQTTGRPSLPLNYAKNIAVYVNVKISKNQEETVSPLFYITDEIKQIKKEIAATKIKDAMSKMQDAAILLMR
jgi:hypothetical protein